MFGLAQSAERPTRGEQRKQLLQERDDRIVEFMRQNRPIAAIAELEGLAEDYARKAVKRLEAQHGIDYKPQSEPAPVGVTEDSRLLRNHLANVLARYRDEPGRHQLEVCTATGLTQAQQVAATQRPNDHNWTLAQMERTARATGQDFTPMMLRALLTRDQYEKVRKCLNI